MAVTTLCVLLLSLGPLRSRCGCASHPGLCAHVAPHVCASLLPIPVRVTELCERCSPPESPGAPCVRSSTSSTAHRAPGSSRRRGTLGGVLQRGLAGCRRATVRCSRSWRRCATASAPGAAARGTGRGASPGSRPSVHLNRAISRVGVRWPGTTTARSATSPGVPAAIALEALGVGRIAGGTMNIVGKLAAVPCSTRRTTRSWRSAPCTECSARA